MYVILSTIIFFIVIGVITTFYLDLSSTVKNTYHKVERSSEIDSFRNSSVDLSKKEPFSILLLGIDTGDLGRIEQGRSDTIMVVTVNQEKKQTTILSIARDTYVDIVGHHTQDKINHAYAFGGASMSMDTVQNYLGIPIDHYISINMKGLKQLVDSIGGIEVNNGLEFSQEDYKFPLGKISLDGSAALAYLRMRYEDPNGDYGRQERQRKLVEALGKKIVGMKGISNYKEILNVMESNTKTDMTLSEMTSLLFNYSDAFTKIKQDQLKGDGIMMDGISYQQVNTQELTRVQNELKFQLDIKN